MSLPLNMQVLLRLIDKNHVGGAIPEDQGASEIRLSTLLTAGILSRSQSIEPSDYRLGQPAGRRTRLPAFVEIGLPSKMRIDSAGR